MATNVVVDFQKARNQYRRTQRESYYGRVNGGSRLLQAETNTRSLEVKKKDIALAVRTLAIGAIAFAALWLGYVAVMGAASHVEDAAAWFQVERDGRFEAREVVVRPGDTLWGIARDHGPADVDVRETIDWIRRNNDMRNATVYPGQVLKVPVAP